MLVSRKVVLGFFAMGLMIMVGCAANTSYNDNKSAKAERYTSKKVGGDTLLSDNTTGLTWTNSAQGCKPLMGGTKSETSKAANAFCGSLSFGGHNDWRLPTVSEMQTLEIQTDQHGVALFYKNSICKRVLARKSDNSLTSISTTNSSPVGRIVGNKFPAGTRCVR